MTRYQVDSEAVLAAASTAQGTIARIQSEVAGLHTELTELQGSWTGPAAAAFQGIVADWRGVQSRVEESLNALNQALAAAGRHYAETEAANARLFAH